MRSRRPITDSPWFWLMLFAAVGLAALATIGPKYARRQARLELQYDAFTEADRRRYEGEETSRAPGAEGALTPPRPGELRIMLWPIATVLLAVLAVGLLGLVREKSRLASGGESNAGGGP